MKNVPTFRIREWLASDATHPVVIEMCRAELAQRGEI